MFVSRYAKVCQRTGIISRFPQTYLLNVIFKNACDCLCMLDALFGDDSEIANGDSIIGYKIVQRILVVINNFIRWETGRHGGQVSLRMKARK
jgi:hypothetical protein